MISQIIKRHIEKYPEMTVQDAVKLVFQAHFGGGHIVTDRDSSFNRIINEWTGLNTAEKFEDIGGGYVRANINAFKREELSLLTEIFMQNENAAVTKAFLKDLDVLKEYFSDTQFIESYKKDIRPISHSDAYRLNYKPSYRVIKKEFALIYSILQQKKNAVIAIDGKAGSGKTTLANTIAKIFDCDIVHTDDFFLPITLRTPNRLNTAGGNIHYERLYDEVIVHLNDAEFSYNIFSCSKMDFDGKIKINRNKPLIIEGSYSMHPYLKKYYDFSVFCDIDQIKQKQRIEKRNPDMLNLFLDKWIPMENKYFDYYNITANIKIMAD